MTSFRFIKYEPYQEHRLGTVSNTITRGLKPVLWDPNPRPRSWHGSSDYIIKLYLIKKQQQDYIFFIQQPKCNMILNSLQFHLYTRHKQIKSYIPFSKWRNTNEKIFILQTVLKVIKLFVLFTTYNQETGRKNVVPDTEPFQ